MTVEPVEPVNPEPSADELLCAARKVASRDEMANNARLAFATAETAYDAALTARNDARRELQAMLDRVTP